MTTEKGSAVVVRRAKRCAYVIQLLISGLVETSGVIWARFAQDSLRLAQESMRLAFACTGVHDTGDAFAVTLPPPASGRADPTAPDGSSRALAGLLALLSEPAAVEA